jgi:hypothetical protein
MYQFTRNEILISYNTVYNTDVISVLCFGHINPLSVLSYPDLISKKFQSICKGKGKVHPRIGHECPEGEYRYSSMLSVTSARDGGKKSLPQLAAAPQKRNPVVTAQEAGWVPGPVWTGAENLTPTGIQSLHHPAHN